MTEPFDSQSAIDRYFDEELDPATFAQLQNWLEANSDAATQFAERAFLHSRLSRIHARNAEPIDLGLEGELASSVQELTKQVEVPSDASQPVVKSPLLGFLDKLPQAIHPVHHPLSFLAAAVLLTSMFWGMAVVFFFPRGDGEVAGERLRPERAPAPFIARVTQVESIADMKSIGTIRLGTFLLAKQRLEWKSGRLHVLFGEGARVAIEGPAELRIDGRNGLTLTRGRMLALVTKASRGFLAKSSTVDVIDLGTEFGMSVQQRSTEVQVFQGSVEVRFKNDQQKVSRRLKMNEAAEFQISPPHGFQVKDVTMNHKAYLSLAAMLTVSVANMAQGVMVTLPASRDTTLMRTTSVVNAFPGPGTEQSNVINRGGQAVMQLGTAGGSGANAEARVLIGFDVSSMPAYSEINSITMRVFLTSQLFEVSGNTPYTIQALPISAANADWVEGVGLGTGGVDQNTGATWNHKNRAGAVDWAGGTGTPTTGGLLSAGTDYEVTMLASHTFNSAAIPAEGTPMDFIFTGSNAALTNLIDNWMTLNPGILLKHSDATSLGDNRRVRFYSSEAGDIDLRPQLIINYAEPLPPAPEPTTSALLGLGGGLVLWAKRRRKSTL